MTGGNKKWKISSYSSFLIPRWFGTSVFPWSLDHEQWSQRQKKWDIRARKTVQGKEEDERGDVQQTGNEWQEYDFTHFSSFEWRRRRRRWIRWQPTLLKTPPSSSSSLWVGWDGGPLFFHRYMWKWNFHSSLKATRQSVIVPLRWIAFRWEKVKFDDVLCLWGKCVSHTCHSIWLCTCDSNWKRRQRRHTRTWRVGLSTS